MKVNIESIGDRLKKYLEYKKIGINHFGRMTQTSGAQISNILNGKNYGINKIINIINTCQDLNLLWLLKGEGEMIIKEQKENYKKDDNAYNYEVISSQNSAINNQKGIKKLLRENQSLNHAVEKLKINNQTLEGAMVYQNMTIDAYKTTIEVLSFTNRDLKELLEHYKSNYREIKSQKTA